MTPTPPEESLLAQAISRCQHLRRILISLPRGSAAKQSAFDLAAAALEAIPKPGDVEELVLDGGKYRQPKGNDPAEALAAAVGPLTGLVRVSLLSLCAGPTGLVLKALSAPRPQLRSMVLTRCSLCGVHDGLTAAFGGMPALETLVLNDVLLDCRACQAIGGAPESLRALEMVGQSYSTDGPEAKLEAVQQLSASVTRLIARCCRLSSARLAVLPRLLSFAGGAGAAAGSGLTELTLLRPDDDVGIDWEGIAEAVGSVTGLRALSITDRSYHVPRLLVAFGRLTLLTRLELTGSFESGRRPQPAQEQMLRSLTAMRKLHLVGSCFGMRALAPVLSRMPGLTDLRLSVAETEGVYLLGPALPPGLTALRLDNCLLYSKGTRGLAEAIGAAGGAPPLTLLDLSSNLIRDVGVAALLPAFRQTSALGSLLLGRNGIGAAGAEALWGGAGAHLKGLTELRLGGNELGAKGVEVLTRGDLCSRLSLLDLDGNGIGSQGAAALGVCFGRGGMPALTELSLMGNRIGLAGATALVQPLLDKARGLAVLKLGGNAISAQGLAAIVPHLSRAIREDSLTTLDLSSNNIIGDDQNREELIGALRGLAGLRSLTVAGNGFGKQLWEGIKEDLGMIRHLDYSWYLAERSR